MLKEIFKRFVVSIYYRSKTQFIIDYIGKKFKQSKLKEFFETFNSLLKIHRQENKRIKKWFTNEIKYFKPQVIGEKKGILLTQLVRDYEYTIQIAVANKILAEKSKLEIYFYDVNWLRWLGWNDKINDIYLKFFKSHVYKVFLGFGKKVVINHEKAYFDQKLIREKLEEIKKQLNTTEDIMSIRFENIEVGDLIYDTYLRYFQKPTIEEINEGVYLTIEVGLNIFYNFDKITKEQPIKALLNTYSTYIEHGIPARVCLSKNIDVYTLDWYSYGIKKITKDYPYHSIDNSLISPNIKINEDKLLIAQKMLESRFKGEIDPAVSYMRTTSFGKVVMNYELEEQFLLNKRNIVIYVHDFYDSPHIDKNLQFIDLYQFLNQTLHNLRDIKNTTVFIKTHPNSILDSKQKTIDLVESFQNPNFIILDETVSNNYIIEKRPDLIVTARGTVAVEMAYFEIPVVALYDNPYINFNFAHSCKTLEEYYLIIKGEKEVEINFDKSQLYSFYYQLYIEQNIQLDYYNIFSSINGSKFSDECLNAIKENKDCIFSENILKVYREKIDLL